MKLGQNIFELRKKQGLSQEQLGEKIEVTRQTISNWELGETSPNPEQLKRLSKELHVSVDELLNNEEISLHPIRKQTKKISNIMKYLFIGFLLLLVVDAITFSYCYINKIGPFEKQEKINCHWTI